MLNSPNWDIWMGVVLFLAGMLFMEYSIDARATVIFIIAGVIAVWVILGGILVACVEEIIFAY